MNFVITNTGYLEREDFNGIKRTILQIVLKRKVVSFIDLVQIIRIENVEFRYVPVKNIAQHTAELVKSQYLEAKD